MDAKLYPTLRFRDADAGLQFLKDTFGFVEHAVYRGDDGKIHHAEISIGTSRIMMADEHPDIQALSPKTIGGSPISIHLYVDDVDVAVKRAVAAGGGRNHRVVVGADDCHRVAHFFGKLCEFRSIAAR